MKIGINAHYLQKNGSGITSYLFNLINNLLLIDQKNEYLLIFNNQENNLFIDNIYPNLKQKVSSPLNYRLKEKSLKSQLIKVAWEKLFLVYEIKREKVEIFHDPAFSAPLLGSIPVIVTVHDLAFLRYPHAFTWKTLCYFKAFLKQTLRRADIIISVSESVKKDLLDLYEISANKIVVIHEGTDEYFKKLYNKEDINRIKKKYKISGDYLLSVSAINPRKNIIRILHAYKILLDKKIDIKLVLVGKKAWLYQNIEKELVKLHLSNKVIFTGHISKEELRILYNGASVFLYPSLYEGFGLPLLEAMACGTPVITSNISSMPEVVGPAGVLVNPLKCEEIAEGIIKLITDKGLRYKKICLGFERVKKFSWKETAKKTLSVYEKLY